MPQGGARGQNLGHLKKSFFFWLLFFSYVINHIFKEQVLFRVDFFPVTYDSRVFFLLFYLLRNHSYLNNRHYLGLT